MKRPRVGEFWRVQRSWSFESKVVMIISKDRLLERKVNGFNANPNYFCYKSENGIYGQAHISELEYLPKQNSPLHWVLKGEYNGED